MGLQFSLLMRLLIGSGFVAGGPAVSSITSATQTEGTSLVHMVTLATAVSVVPAAYTFSISSVTANTPSDYTATPTFSSGITLSGGTISVPVGVSSFTVTVPTAQDTIFEGSETYSITVGSMTSTGTLTDDDSAPTIASVSSASATEGSSITHVVVVTGTAQAARTFAITLSGGTATGGTDYTSTLTNGMFSAGVTTSGGNVSVPPGTTVFTCSIPTSVDALVEGNETYTLQIGSASGTGTIVDANTGAHFFLNLSSPTNATLADVQAIGTITTVPADFYLNLTSPTNATIADAQAIGTITGSLGSSAITPSIVASRTSGVAPLLVHFDASGTTAASLTSYPFHELEYTWNFGDATAGSWSYGVRAQFGLSTLKNVDKGPIAAHVFETHGTFDVVTGIRYDGTTATPITTTITVLNPDAVFAETATICISTSGNFTGAPSGALQVTTSSVATINSHIAPGKRVLFCRGETWNIGSSIIVDPAGVAGAGHLGAYGTGARPKFVSTASILAFNVSSTNAAGVEDWRITDIEHDGANLIASDTASMYTDHYHKHVLFHKVKVSRAKYGFHGKQAASGTLPDVLGIVDCEVADGALLTSVGGNGIYTTSRRMVLMGTSVRPNMQGEHACRTSYSTRGVYAHNSFSEVVSGKSHLSIRAPLTTGDALGVFAPYADGGYIYTEKIVMRDNYTVQADDSETSMGVGPVNQNNGIGRVRDVVMECNWGNRCQYGLFGSQISMRNNITNERPSNGLMVGLTHMAQQPDPIDLWVYNNSYFSTHAVYHHRMIEMTGDAMAGSYGTFRNNLVYAPNRGASNLFVTYPGNFVVTESNNTSNTQTTPNFTTTPPTTPAQFKPTSGYALGGGTTVPVWSDFLDNTVTGSTRTIGAIKE